MALAEKAAIQLIISFAEATGARVHVVHMSTKEGVELVREAKKRGVKVTAETCPHYLMLNAEDSMSERGTFAKIAPPLREKDDNIVHWQALADGTIDFVGTDHAPYEIATEKMRRIQRFGTASLESREWKRWFRSLSARG